MTNTAFLTTHLTNESGPAYTDELIVCKGYKPDLCIVKGSLNKETLPHFGQKYADRDLTSGRNMVGSFLRDQ